MTARASTNAERQALRERAISVLHSRSVRRAWEWFQAAATPEAILDLLNCIEELEERAGEKDPEDDS